MKTCFKCGVTKRLSEFYRHPMMWDGRLNKCKECAKLDVRSNRLAKVSYYRAYDKIRFQRPERKAAFARQHNKWKRANPEKRAAHILVGNAIRAGRLVKMPCEVCGGAAHAHHDDYAKPLEVRWLCPIHHSEHHRRNKK